MKKWDIATIVITLVILHFFIWLRPGLILGGGEAGLMFYQPETVKTVNQFAWANKALGNPTGIVATAYPTMWVISYLKALTLPSEFIQALFFFLINLSGSFGIYFLVRSQLPENKKAPLIAALFYVFNITAMTIIWNRFQYTFMVFYGGMPMALFLFTKALQTNKLNYTLATSLMLLLMGFSFASLPLIELTILVLGLYALYFILASNNKKKAFIRVVKISAIIIGISFLNNAWWIIQFYEVMKNSVYVSSVAYTPQGNLSTFLVLSDSLGNLSYVFRMMHKDFFTNMNSVWMNVYVNPLITILTFSVPILAFLPLVRKKIPSIIYFYLCYSIFVLYLMKGAHAPFGFLFTYLFNQLRFLEAFRNPFEKFSLLLPLGYAPLIGYSLDCLINKIYYKRYRNISLTLSIILLCGITVFPIWNRWVFTSNMKPSNNLEIGDYVDVPDEYIEVNNLLNSDNSLFRAVLIPFRGEGIQQNWKYGYSGVELSLELFDKPMLSLSTGVQFLPPIADRIQDLLIRKPEHFIKLMQLTNSKYLILRNDLAKSSHKYEISELEHKINLTGQFDKIRQFGKLTVYKQKDDLFREKVYAANEIIVTHPLEQNVVEILPFADYGKNTVFISKTDMPIVASTNGTEGYIYTANESTSKERITEEQAYYIPIETPEIQEENALIELPHVSILPNDNRYPVVKIREVLERRGKKGTDIDFVHLRQTGKRLVESEMLFRSKGDQNSIRKTLKSYNLELKKIKYEYIYNFVGVRKELVRHIIVLQNIRKQYPNSNSYSEISESLTYLNSLFENGIPASRNADIRYLKRNYEIELPQTKEYKFLVDEYSEKDASSSGMTTTLVINGVQHTLPVNTELNLSLLQGNNSIKFPTDDTQAINQKQLITRTIIVKEEKSRALPIETPALQTKRINPAHYEVQVSEVEEPFILVFAESFHPLWEAYIDGKKVDSQNHFLANSYSNAWNIERKGSYSITLLFKPQQTLEKYAIISKITTVIVVIALVSILSAQWWKNTRRTDDSK